MSVKITDLGPVVLPLIGTEQIELAISALESRRVAVSDLLAAVGGLDATFITVTANAQLPNERILTAGANISIVDGGAGLPITISVPGLISTLAGLTDVNLAGQAQFDMLFNIDGVSWADTAGAVTWDNSISIFRVGGGIRAQDGNAAAPGYTFTTSLTTGLYRFMADVIGFSAGATAAASMSATEFTLRGADSLFISEKAAALADVAAFGQLWVRNDVPNVLVFTDDTGVDTVLGSGGGGVGISGVPVANQISVWANGTDILGDSDFTWSPLTGEMVINHAQAPGSGRPALRINTDVAAPAMRFATNQTSYSLMELNANAGSNVGFDLDLNFAGIDSLHFLRLTDQAGSFLQTWQRDGVVNISNGQLVIDPTGNAAVSIPSSTLLELGERAAANPLTAAVGQLWVRNDIPNVLVFTDDTGVDTVLGAGGGFDPTAPQTISGAWNFTNVGGLDLDVSCELRMRNNADTSTTFIQNTGPTLQFGIAGADFGSGIFEIGSSWLKVQINRSIFMDEQAAAGVDVAGDGQWWVRNDAPNVPMFTDDTGVDIRLDLITRAGVELIRPGGFGGVAELASVGSTDAELRELLFTHQDGTSRGAIGHFGGTLLGIANDIDSGLVEIRGRSPGPIQRTLFRGDPDGASSLFNIGVLAVETDAAGLRINLGSLFVDEKAAAAADVAGLGQLWVRNDAPNDLMFTDDAGSDFAVGYAPGRVTTNGSFNFNTAGNRAANWVGSYFDGTNNTITLEDAASVVNWPIGTAVQIIAPGSGVQTVTEGVGVTLFLDNGVDTVGGVTVSTGVQTIFRQTAANYIIWGSGIT